MAQARRRRVKFENRPPPRTENRWAAQTRKINAAALDYAMAEIVPTVAAGAPVTRELLNGLAVAADDALPLATLEREAIAAARATQAAHWRAWSGAITQSTGLRVIGSDVPGIPPSIPRGAGRALVPRPLASIDLLTDQFVDESLRLISTLRSGVVDGVGDMIVRNQHFGGTPEELAERLRKQWARNGVPSKIPTRRLNSLGEPVFVSAEKHAELIARDQLQKLHARINQARQTAAGVTKYRWRGEMDNRERESHVQLEGQIFSWDDPPDDGHPGTPIACRCTAEAVIDADQVIRSDGFVEVEVASDIFSERQTPEGITLINPGPGAML